MTSIAQPASARPVERALARPSNPTTPPTTDAGQPAAGPAGSGDRYTRASLSKFSAAALAPRRDLQLDEPPWLDDRHFTAALEHPAPGDRTLWGREAARLGADPRTLRGDKSFVLSVVRRSGQELQFASKELRSDPEVVRAAVQSQGSALEWAGDGLKADKALALEAIRDDEGAFRFVDPQLRRDPEVLLAVSRLAAPKGSLWRVLQSLPDELKHDRSFQLELLRNNAWAIESLPSAMLKDPGFVAEAAMAFPVILDQEPLSEGREQLLATRPELRQRYEFVKQGLEQLGIEDGMRLRSADLLDEVLRNRLEPRASDGRPMAAVVMCKSDTDRSHAMLQHNLDELSRNYRVMYYEARTDRDLVTALKDAGRDGVGASLVVLGGHGANDQVNLGNADGQAAEQGKLDLKDEGHLRIAGLGSVVRPDAKVVLMSCSTGEGRAEAENIANMLGRVLPGREVYAPIRPTMDQLKFDERGRFVDPGYRGGEEETYRI